MTKRQVTTKIMNRIQSFDPGALFVPKDFLDIGSRTAVDKVLSRLSADNRVSRIARGIYHIPKKHRLLGDIPPSVDDIVKTFAAVHGLKIQISGVQAVHLLGLTTQVPVNPPYLTDGQSKTIQIGKIAIVIKHASPKIMAGAGTTAGTVLQAIRFIGKQNLDNAFDPLKKQLLVDDKQQLKQLIRFAPDWAYSFIIKLTL